MIQEPKTVFEEQAKRELFETAKAFHACKHEDGQSVSSYLLKMKSYLDTLKRLGYVMPNELGVSLILNSLNKDYDLFVQIYNMHSIRKTLDELHVMLKLHKKGILKKAKPPTVLAICEGKIQKDKKKPQGVKGKAKGKNKLAYAPKTKISPPPKRENLAKESIYHHCKETDMDGNVHTFKSRLVAKGFTQTYRVDYGETFSPVTDVRAIRILLAIAALYDYDIWQMDVKTASLNGHLSEDVYMVKPKGFMDPKYLNKLIALCQGAYLEKILKNFRMKNSKKGYTPMMEKTNYRKSQDAKTPTETAVKTILKYLRNTKDIVLVYGAKPEDELKVSCYADATFQIDKDDTKSQTRYVFVLNGEAVDWKSAKQSTTAIGVMPSNKRPMEMLCDNEPALAIASDPRILKGSRHSQRKYHYIHKVIQEGEIVLKNVHTDDNLADPFTKPVPLNKHFEHATEIGIVPASSLM
nr:zinc finger, CCHC-type [Tanacetum cinerariifolium]